MVDFPDAGVVMDSVSQDLAKEDGVGADQTIFPVVGVTEVLVDGSQLPQVVVNAADSTNPRLL